MLLDDEVPGTDTGRRAHELGRSRLDQQRPNVARDDVATAAQVVELPGVVGHGMTMQDPVADRTGYGNEPAGSTQAVT